MFQAFSASTSGLVGLQVALYMEEVADYCGLLDPMTFWSSSQENFNLFSKLSEVDLQFQLVLLSSRLACPTHLMYVGFQHMQSAPQAIVVRM